MSTHWGGVALVPRIGNETASGADLGSQSMWKGVLGPVLVFGVLAALRLPWLHAPLVTQDEGIIVLYAQQILDGRLPQRDFYTVYGPGTFGLTAGAFALFGSELVVERLVGLAFQALMVGGVYRLALSRGRAVAVGASLVSVLCLTPLGLAAYAWVGGLACIVWGLVLLQGRTRLAPAFALLALCAIFRPEMALPALAAGMPFLTSWAAVRRALIGVSIGVAPSLAFYLTWGQRIFANAVLERGLVNAKHELGGAVVVILAVAGAMAAVLVFAAWRRRTSESISRALLVLLMLPQLVQRTDLDHFAYVAAIAAPLAFVTLTGPAATGATAAVHLRWLALVVGVAALVVPSRFAGSTSTTTAYEVAGRAVDVDVNAVPALDTLRRSVLAVAPHGAKLFIGTQDMRLPSVTPVQLYFLFPELRADAYYLELPIGISPTVGRRIADDVRNADVLLLSRFPADMAHRLNPYVPLGPRDADDAVRAGFCVAGGSAELQIMVRCAKSAR
ncbi:hypothetical protein [Terrabacter sp. 2RAF25]|uniref:hypothetical protein n=1 Tax=Terrabacter sp. 2RAF25 TaxID=3232998 RepID=UPI003F980C26